MHTTSTTSLRSLVPHALAALCTSVLASTARAQATVPDLDLIANPKTLAEVQAFETANKWTDNYAVVAEMVGSRRTNSTLVRQEPDAGSQLTAGQLMHLYVAGSGGSGPIGDQPVVQWITISMTILGLFCFFSRFFTKRG